MIESLCFVRKRLLFGFLITAILSINGLLIGDEGSEPTLEELTSRYIELRDAAHKGDETAIEFLIKLGESMPMAGLILVICIRRESEFSRTTRRLSSGTPRLKRKEI